MTDDATPRPRRSRRARSAASPTRSSRTTAARRTSSSSGCLRAGTRWLRGCADAIEEFEGVRRAGRPARHRPLPRRRDSAPAPPRVRPSDIPVDIDGEDGRARRRRALHRAAASAPRSTRCTTSAGLRASGSPCSSTGATANCPSAPTSWARTSPRRSSRRCGVRLPEVDGEDAVYVVWQGGSACLKCSSGRRHRAPPRPRRCRQRLRRTGRTCSTRTRSLAAEIELIMETADGMREIRSRPVGKVATLRGATVVTLFYEQSTRTRASFEVAGEGARRGRGQHHRLAAAAWRRASRWSTRCGRWRRSARTCW